MPQRNDLIVDYPVFGQRSPRRIADCVNAHQLAAVGLIFGDMKSVRQYAEEFAENLNQRSLQGYSAYAARRLQKK